MGVAGNTKGGDESGPGIGAGAGAGGFFLMSNTMPRMISPMTATPPTAPPTIGPIGVDEDCCGCGEGAEDVGGGLGAVEDGGASDDDTIVSGLLVRGGRRKLDDDVSLDQINTVVTMVLPTWLL